MAEQTEERWTAEDDGNGILINGIIRVPVYEGYQEDARQIVAAPDMLAELRRVEWSAELEWWPNATAPGCPTCRCIKPDHPFSPYVNTDRVGHRPDCTLAAAIAKATDQ